MTNGVFFPIPSRGFAIASHDACVFMKISEPLKGAEKRARGSSRDNRDIFKMEKLDATIDLMSKV